MCCMQVRRRLGASQRSVAEGRTLAPQQVHLRLVKCFHSQV